MWAKAIRCVRRPTRLETDGNRDSHNRLRDLPELLREFTDNLEDTELRASAHSSPESDLEYPTTVATTSRKHSSD